jgi:uncharacterized membrane protein
MSNNDIFVYGGVYDSVDDAKADYEAVRDLHSIGAIGTYDAAIVAKDDNGKVHVKKHEKPTQHGAWSGLGVGALLGVIFPPSILASGAVGTVAGGLIGHFEGGLSRSDMKELGDLLDDGQATLLVIGKDELAQAIDDELASALKHAKRTFNKEINADAKAVNQQLDQAIDESLATA